MINGTDGIVADPPLCRQRNLLPQSQLMREKLVERQRCSPENTIEIQDVHQTQVISKKKSSRHNNTDSLQVLLRQKKLQTQKKVRYQSKMSHLLRSASHSHSKSFQRILRQKAYSQFLHAQTRTQSS